MLSCFFKLFAIVGLKGVATEHAQKHAQKRDICMLQLYYCIEKLQANRFVTLGDGTINSTTCPHCGVHVKLRLPGLNY